MKKFWKTKTDKPASPDDGELLAFLDGEVPPPRQAEIRQLLESDWSLRVRLDALERDVAAYVSVTQPPASSAAPPFDDLWRNLQHRAALEPDTQETSVWIVWRARMRALLSQPIPLRVGLSMGLVLLLTAGLAFWLLHSERLQKVSAEELVQRATQAEVRSLQRVSDPVIYRKIQLRRIGEAETVEWESWKDVRPAGQFRQRIGDERNVRWLREREENRHALLMELETIFRFNQLDAERPLSAASFATWRKQLRQFTDTLTEQTESWRLTTSTAAPHTPNTILAASLLVRKADWHALSLRLQVQGAHETREYELREIAYEVLPLQALTVFADLAPTTTASATPTASSVAASASPSLAPSVSLPSAAALQEAEVAALYALHQLQADLGEQIEVVREDNRQIIVRGLVEQTERKQQLTEALRAIPLVAPQIQTIEEAAQQLKSANTTRTPETTLAAEPAITATPQVNVFQQKLEQQFMQRGLERNRASQQSAELSNAAVAEARAALSEAWALRRLSERFQSGETQPRIAEMMRNHTARLRIRQHKLQTQLETLLIGIGGTVAPVTTATPDTMPQRVMQVFQSVEQLHNLTNSLFAGAGSTSDTAEISARRLLTALQQMDSALRNFAQ